MESLNTLTPYQQDNPLLETTSMAIQMPTGTGNRSSRRPSLRTNFSYPKLIRHESNESRSSNGSAPGMTDASDSDISFDEDGIYNTSAGELWDSFWPDDEEPSTTYRQSQESLRPLLRPKHQKDYLKINPIHCTPFTAAEGTFKITTRGYDPEEEEEPPSPCTMTQPAPLESTLLLSTPPRPMPKRSPVTYSIYPKPTAVVSVPVSVPRHPHPPRTSSLSFEPPSPPRRPSFLRGSRSSAALKASKSTHNMNSLFIAPSAMPYNINKTETSPQQATSATSVPVSPAYPPPPTPRTLRPSASAFSLRDKIRARSSDSKGSASHDHHDNTTTSTAALTPLLPSPLPEPLQPTTAPAARSQFVSVFELDSDSESADERGASFARRITRGLHKKSTNEKRAVAQRKASASAAVSHSAALDAALSEKEGGERGGSLSRKRGGSLGRIFGFIGK
ncbi:hypothetical protein F5Y03DRAFT_411045 [Xylaria venustula]|nr:hypothetical protein F5Y03DRAFT_411045 [Xylaria venustula]